MFQIKNYKFGIDIKGILLFLIIMIPNIIWFLVPAPIDPLRNESITPSVDVVAQVFQILMVAALAIIRNHEGLIKFNKIERVTMLLLIVLYFMGWVFYYTGIVNAIIHLDLCIAPCMAFIAFSYWRKNAVALLSAVGFTVCHVIFVCMNFIFN